MIISEGGGSIDRGHDHRAIFLKATFSAFFLKATFSDFDNAQAVSFQGQLATNAGCEAAGRGLPSSNCVC